MNKEVHTIIANLEGCIGMYDYLLTPKASNLLVSYIEELQQENKKLNGDIQTYDILLKSNIEENKQLKDNWNMLKEYLHNQIPTDKTVLTKHIKIFEVLDKMQELEKGSDSNE